MVKKILINILLGVLIFVSVFANISLAAVAVTDENLSEALQKFVTSEANEKNYKVSVENNVIDIEVDGEIYKLNYDLTDKPTFWIEAEIQEGMSYQDFKNKTDNFILTILGYIAVANIQGVEIEDASAYILASYLIEALNGISQSKDSYVIIDDINMSEGVELEKTDDPKTIYASEFGEKVMEYVNHEYKEKQTMTDSTGINSYEVTTEQKDVTEDSCKLVSTLTVNLDADFSQLNGYAKKVALNSDITKENADVKFTLKVGQKCVIKTDEKIVGHELYGNGCIEFNDDYTEIVAKKVGEANGYIYIDDVKKSFYITVEPKAENEILGEATLEILKTVTENKYEVSVEQKDESGNIKVENNEGKEEVADLEILPKTGEETNVFLIVLYVIVGICGIGLIALVITSKKKK